MELKLRRFWEQYTFNKQPFRCVITCFNDKSQSFFRSSSSSNNFGTAKKCMLLICFRVIGFFVSSVKRLLQDRD